jgi:fructokinase
MTLRIGVDLGGTKTEGIVMDATGSVLHTERRVTPAQHGYDTILKGVCDLVRDLEQRAGSACPVGIGTPGSISSRTGLLKNSNTVCLNGTALQSDLERLLGREVRIENDANCFALAEAHAGAARDARIVFGVIMGTGVGGGIVVNGELLSGAQHIAGEWGHNVLEADGPLCYCGKHGCVETLISGPGLARDHAASGGDASLDAAAIAARAEAGDPLAAGAMARFHDRFGRALAVVINILDPDIVVLGGGLSNIRSLYAEGRDAVARYVFNDEVRTRIVRNTLGDSAGVYGAAWLWPAAPERHS